ncbi:MAG: glycosyltransferase family 39 protein [Candidatus Omnitrophica bacterium]|nr:glycosyltransferase family 39 protein [Candidatus Omnitrophota bacterium]
MSLKNKSTALVPEDKKFIFVLSVIFLAAALIRIYHLGFNDFWYDEAWNLTNGKVLNVSDFATFQTGPVFFFLLTHILFILNSPEFVLRLVPFAFGLLSVPAIYLLASALFDRRIGLISAFFLAISPVQVYYSQEYSSYSLIVLLSILAVYFFVKMLASGKISHQVGFVVFSILGLYTHYSVWLLLFSQNLAFFFFFRGRGITVRRWLVIQGIIFFLFMPHLSWSIDHMRRIVASDVFFWVPQLTLRTFLHTFGIFTLGYYASALLYGVSLVLSLPLCLAGIRRYNNEGVKGGTYLLLIWIFLPYMLILASGIFSKNHTHYLYRIFLYLSPAFYILSAKGLNRMAKKTVVVFILFAFIFLSAISLNNYFNDKFPLPVYPYRPSIFEKKENRSASLYIKERYRKGDMILHNCRATFTPFLYYHGNKLSEKWVVTDKDIDWLHWRRFFYALPLSRVQQEWFDSVFQHGLSGLPGGHKRIWLVSAGWGLEDNPQSDIKDLLDRQFALVDSRAFRGIKVFLYDCPSIDGRGE